MDASTAWSDLVTGWKENKDLYSSFSSYIGLKMGVDSAFECGSLEDDTLWRVSTFLCGSEKLGPGRGVGGLAIVNSFVAINGMFRTVEDTITDSFALDLNTTGTLDSFADDFAPGPLEPDTAWRLVLLDVFTIGASAVLGPLFKNRIADWPRFAEEGSNAAAKLKNTTILAVQQGTTVAKDLLTRNPAEWDSDSQDDFKTYSTTVLSSWPNHVVDNLSVLFDGSDESIDRLGNMIADGSFISGSARWGGGVVKDENSQTLKSSVARTFFGIAISEIWRMSGTHSFVIDTGFDCDKDLSDLLQDDVRDKTGVCHNGKRYFLGVPEGNYSPWDGTYGFSVPPGVDALGEDSQYGGVTIEDVIVGSLNTFEANGGNDAPRPQDLNEGDINDLAVADDIRTPGLMRLPVCSPETAWRSWGEGDASDSAVYPCNIVEGKD
ncbi:uncharacterized protein F5Z01DRAFT_557238 [Emericellopsis atlantica]|uniref:Uncharacterized protein n=1 Tax=Emericellopsis atlantica TaxID=2614577 RepID=A0A9P7ZPG6_9HYPO|nr:uncharacterized protein F5Z01DRAFT_557238 [Emericellopsis atlantica]KAG9255775.1 hypothetical protein F5Z01DRAFT_557238 [Emericellopsis atlantica]